ncbi:MAG: fibrobacter succinogenes major paralogous domain-containing protein [Fibrobacter sp.]|nr:fibrobacter succinogenes major paralogous domain-containing protein [Fibrobacter sp.]
MAKKHSLAVFSHQSIKNVTTRLSPWSVAIGAMFAFIFTACGEDSVTENTRYNANIVAEAEDLPTCEKSNEGEQIFVTSETSLRVCANGKWRAATQNSNGTIDFHCETESLADSSGLKIICGGDSIGVVLNGRNGVNGSDGKNGTDGKNGSGDASAKNGVDGKDGANGKDGKDGKDGTSCTAVTLRDNSGMKILCGGDSVGVVLNGHDGEKGADGKNGTNGTNGENGADGEGCILKQIDAITLRIVCGKDSATFLVNEVLNPNSSSSSVKPTSSSSSISNKVVENRNDLVLCNSSNKNARVLVNQDSLYFDCDGVKWTPDSTRGYLVKSVSILGAAQKGPFKFGSPLELRELRLYNDTLRYSGIKYVDEISSNKGNYVIPKVSLVYPYAEIAVRGLWRNEVTGEYSADSMTLQALTDLSNRTNANVNLLTHLEYARAMKLVEKGYSVSAAKKQADYEIMTAFGFATTIKFSEDLSIFEDYDDNLWYDAANATLLAMSIIFMGDRTDAEILSAIEAFRQDVADDGEWNATDAEKTKAAMADWAETFDKTIIQANVKSWNILEIPDYEQYMDIFWNNAYGLGGCASTRYNVVAPVTNKLSANYNVHYICKSTGWQKATDFEKDTYEWSAGKEGDVRAGNVNTNKFYVYENGKWRASASTIENDLGACVTSRNNEVGKSDGVYYTCKSKNWTKSTALEYDTYGWAAGTEGEMKEGSVVPSNHYVYENGKWRATSNDVEYDLGICVTSRNNEVGKSGGAYYTCKSKKWTESTALEYDTYGWAAGVEGEMKEGSVDPSNHYVYENGVWRASVGDVEYEYGACVESREGERQILDNSYYVCESKKWTSATILEYDTYGLTCSKNGAIVDGFVNADNKYVCDADMFRTANEMEVNLNKGCVSYTENDEIRKEISENQDSVYECHGGKWESSVVWTDGKLHDSRDGKSYRVVAIGSQTWMAENLNYADTINYPGMKKRNWCYNNILDSCSKYGRLYTWAAAMDSAGTFSTNGKNCGYGKTCSRTNPVRGICPEEWHLPTKAEWDALYSAMGLSPYAMQVKGYEKWPKATNTYGFSALPAGRYNDGNFFSIGDYAGFWSSAEYSSNTAGRWKMDASSAGLSNIDKDIGYSVRCVKDSP